MRREDEPVPQERINELLTFHTEFGMRYTQFDQTLEDLCRLTGSLTIRQEETGIIVSVPDLQGNSTDIINLKTENPAYFQLIKDFTEKKANVSHTTDKVQEGTYIPVFGIRCNVQLTESSLAMHMAPAMEVDPEAHVNEIFKQLKRS